MKYEEEALKIYGEATYNRLKERGYFGADAETQKKIWDEAVKNA